MIVISGITSSIGICLANFLANKGVQVVGFARNPEKAAIALCHPLIQLKKADLNHPSAMNEICADATGVVHLAALSTPWGRYEDFYRVNVQGTDALLRASSLANVKRFIHISTPSLYFDFTHKTNITEASPLPKKAVNAYAETKKLAEDLVDQSDLACITLRPRAIFGPHDQTLLPRILKICQTKGIPQFGKVSPMVDITYVENLAEAIWLSLNAPTSCCGQKYNITNGEPCALVEILELLLTKLSIPIRKKQISFPLAMGCAYLSELQSKITKKEPLITRYGIGVLKYSQTLSIEKAKRALQYNPTISLKEGIDRYAHWLQSQ